MADESDDDIIRGFLEGKPSAHRAVDRWIRPLVGSRHWGLREEADDILQEIRRRLYENLLNGRFLRGSSLRTYVSQMAKYVCIEFLRRRKRARQSDFDLTTLPDPASGPEDELGRRERLDLARSALSKMSEECRELFELIFVAELSYQDIAGKLGIAAGTVKSRAFRCRESLARMISNRGSDAEPGAPGGH